MKFTEGMPIKKPTFRIENVVASVTLGQELDLEKIAERVPNAEYSPEHLGPS
ncbi:MAG: hypothetical protein DRJ55_04920 [Thermoprotei archaeon]|nr:MAG: hypothetical protein DRJ55_04920 [Thermoprotei archaeon]